MHGATNELINKFRTRCTMMDPITNEPRFGPKMLAKVQELLQRYDAIKDAIETTDLVTQIEYQATHRREQQREQATLLEQERLKAQEAEAVRLSALKEQREREDEEERERLAIEREKEQQWIAELAVLAQQKREERERVRKEDARRAQEEQDRIAHMNAAIPVGKEGLGRAIEMLRESTGSAVRCTCLSLCGTPVHFDPLYFTIDCCVLITGQAAAVAAEIACRGVEYLQFAGEYRVSSHPKR